MGISFTGLASGIDSQSLISQLVAAERSSATKLATKQSDLNTQKSIVGSLSSVLASLGTAAKALASSAGVSPRSAVSSDAHVSVAASATAGVTTHTVRVQQLARAQVVSSRTFVSKVAGVAGNGSVDLTGNGTTKTVSWTATDSLDAIATKINDAKVGTSAAVLYDGTSYRLVLTAQKTGTANAVAFVDAGDSLELSDPANVKVPPRDATVLIDNIPVTRSTNIFDDAVTGLTITAKTEHVTADPDTALTIKLDTDALRDKVKGMVTAYNAVNSALHVQLDYTGSQKGTNTLFGDSTLRQLQTALNSTFGAAYGSDTLATLGVTRDRTGAMTLDESKLTAALSTNANAVEALFVTGGLSTAVTDLTTEYTRAGDGILASKTKSLAARQKTLQTQIESINRRADGMQSNLEQQFNALETAMSQLKSQSSYLSRIM